jgi:NOL1/NOP2/fmu family ribosome biogenesis protein
MWNWSSRELVEWSSRELVEWLSGELVEWLSGELIEWEGLKRDDQIRIIFGLQYTGKGKPV